MRIVYSTPDADAQTWAARAFNARAAILLRALKLKRLKRGLMLFLAESSQKPIFRSTPEGSRAFLSIGSNQTLPTAKPGWGFRR